MPPESERGFAKGQRLTDERREVAQRPGLGFQRRLLTAWRQTAGEREADDG